MHPNHDRKPRVGTESGGAGNIKVEASKFVMFECLRRDIRRLKIEQSFLNGIGFLGLRTDGTESLRN
jgi:hypothetical protein